MGNDRGMQGKRASPGHGYEGLWVSIGFFFDAGAWLHRDVGVALFVFLCYVGMGFCSGLSAAQSLHPWCRSKHAALAEREVNDAAVGSGGANLRPQCAGGDTERPMGSSLDHVPLQTLNHTLQQTCISRGPWAPPQTEEQAPSSAWVTAATESSLSSPRSPPPPLSVSLLPHRRSRRCGGPCLGKGVGILRIGFSHVELLAHWGACTLSCLHIGLLARRVACT